jgi:hypothetical protein
VDCLAIRLKYSKGGDERRLCLEDAVERTLYCGESYGKVLAICIVEEMDQAEDQFSDVLRRLRTGIEAYGELVKRIKRRVVVSGHLPDAFREICAWP